MFLGAGIFQFSLRRRRHRNMSHNVGHRIPARAWPAEFARSPRSGLCQNNGSNGDYEAQIGGDIPVGHFGVGNGLLSLDGIYKSEKDAVNLSLSGASNAAGVPIAPYLPQTLTATISNNQSVMVAGRYRSDRCGYLPAMNGINWRRPVIR